MPSFVCSCCGGTHDSLPTDTGYTLPDVVWALPEDQRAEQAKFGNDLCVMGERFFIRCILQIPFTEQPGYYGWGAWAEVERPAFERYVQLYDADGTQEPPVRGWLANDINAYGTTLGLPVRIQFRTSSQRPRIGFEVGLDQAIAREAAAGMSYARYHEILVMGGQIGLP
jgi:hypothetical protein